MKLYTFTLEIPYSKDAIRSRAKKAGAKWNAARKVWVLTLAEDRLQFHGKLLDYAVSKEEVSSEGKTEGKIDMGVGFLVDNNPAAIARVNLLGYDAIED